MHLVTTCFAICCCCCAGDFGHGILMMMFAAYLLINEKVLLKQKLDEIFDMLFGGRYCIVLMATFSIFTGLIYNEFFSMPMTLFGGTRARVSGCCRPIIIINTSITIMFPSSHSDLHQLLLGTQLTWFRQSMPLQLTVHLPCLHTPCLQPFQGSLTGPRS
jgi:vacuolar-type H+-ATPase subunit I/STV1